ncbi:MAG: hypothetical protein AAGA68_10745 [Pseudomonadota bacterium]
MPSHAQASRGRRVPPYLRLLLGAVAAVGLSLLAGLLGIVIAGRCCVPAGSGLAGPGIVVGYGLLAALLGAGLGILLAIRLGPRALLILSGVAGVGGTIVAVLLGLAVAESARKSADALEEAYARLPPFELVLDLTDADPFARFEADWAKRETVVVDAKGRTCRRALNGREAVPLLESLRAVEGVLLQAADPCAGKAGAPVQSLRFLVQEGRPPNTSGELAISDACLAATPALGKPVEAAREALRRAGRCLP